MSADQTLSVKVEGDELGVKVEGDELVIRIGIDTLAFASEENDDWHQWDGVKFVPLWKVVDNKGWAEDVIHEMLKEEEDGSSPLTNFLDKMSMSALDQGSLSVWNPVEDPNGPEDYD
jgi:hypothetical protein